MTRTPPQPLSLESLLSPPLPAWLQVDPTTRCNLDCATCTRKNLASLDKNLTLDEFRHLAEQVPTLRHVKLQGMGEPLMNPHLTDILAWGRSRGLTFETICNGTLLHRRLDVVPLVRDLIVSVDAVDPALFKRLRSGNVDRVLDNVGLAAREKRKRGWTTRLHLSATVSHLNLHEMPRLAAAGAALGVDQVNFIEVENWTAPVLDPEGASRRFIHRARQDGHRIRAMAQRIHRAAPGPKIKFQPAAPRRDGCAWPQRMAYVDIDGYVTPCCLRTNPRAVHFGNVRTEPFEAIWRSDAYRRFRLAVLTGEDNGICDRCPD